MKIYAPRYYRPAGNRVPRKSYFQNITSLRLRAAVKLRDTRANVSRSYHRTKEIQITVMIT